MLVSCQSQTDLSHSDTAPQSIEPDTKTNAIETAKKTTSGPAGAPSKIGMRIPHSNEAWRLEGQAMAAAADPRAVEAALGILRQGGHAVDAAIAAHAVLGLVEPQSSGIGGGAFMMVYERETGEITVYDGREQAPQSMTPQSFMRRDGKPMHFAKAWQSNLSIGIPGIPALYHEAHKKHGKAAWVLLFSPAIQLAENGFEVSPRLASLLAKPSLRAVTRLDDDPITSAYFYPDGKPLTAGTIRRNVHYANSLRLLAQKGPEPFYSGVMADAIMETVGDGLLSKQDMANYRIRKSRPICTPFRQYRICSAPPPSSGGIAQGMIMGLYERFDVDSENDQAEAVRAFVDAQRMAYADRDHYVADPEFVSVPVAELLHPDYLDARAQSRPAPNATPQPGDPGIVLGKAPMIDQWGQDTSKTRPGTTHLSIVDVYGNVVSMTATIESAFGASRMVGGFLLNNELTDFALNPTKNGKPVANAPAGGKRPRSSMSPSLVFDQNGDFLVATGSPGGNSIIAYVAKTLVGLLDWQMETQTAIDFPNIIARGEAVKIETNTDTGREIADMLDEHGYKLKRSDGEISGLHVIVARQDHYEGGADSRREGVALGASR